MAIDHLLKHEALRVIAEATRGTSYEGHLWLVGGCVRDALLGLGGESDFDIVLESDALELGACLYREGIAKHPPVVYPRFGTALARVRGANIELATARRESYSEESRKPEVEPATLLEDALRRDFTVNTLLLNLHTEELADPLGSGLTDLDNRILRTPRDPRETFFDDPLRMMRAVRFRWKLGFDPAAGLYESIQSEAHRLDIISAERIRDEWMKMLARPTASSAMRDLMALGLLDRFAPEFRALVGVEQGRFHHLDVWDHTLLVVDKVFELEPEPSLDLVLAALLHDIGKPATRTLDEQGNTRFFGHETLGATLARNMLERLRLAGDAVDPVVKLVSNHMRLGSFATFTPSAARRLIRDMGGLLEHLFLLVEADASSLRPGVRAIDLSPMRALVAQVQVQTPAEKLESPLSGEEIMELLGIEPGPKVGEAKRLLLEEVLEGRLDPDNKDAARSCLNRARSDDQE